VTTADIARSTEGAIIILGTDSSSPDSVELARHFH
jgi:hypothetical protein